ncbi:MAG: hypothetical protein M1419_04980 [Bacteroidetes bacterium]|nr:hypothetical protein [Patescibacteria group bacterium]MCL5991437.1 hypothetical protein [Bacteroidota bacterium]
MEIIQNNPMSSLIYLFLDGEADSTQQDLLFKNLADNPELQSEFQDAVTLNKSLSADSKNLIPSNELTHNLFVKAGFESGAAGSTASGILSDSARNPYASGIIGRIKSSIIPATIGSIITAALLTTGLYLLDIDFHSDRHAAVNQEGLQRQVVTQNENPIPVVKSEAVRGVNKSNKLSNVIRRRTVPVFSENTQTTPVNNVETVTENTFETIENVQEIVIPVIQQSDLVRMNEKPELRYVNNNFSHLNTAPSVGFDDLSIPQKLNMLVEVKGINNLAYSDERIMDYSKVLLKNFGVIIFFRLSDHWLIGGGIGNEQMQIYEVVRDEFSNVSFLSEPNLNWYSASVRYITDKLEFLGNLQPYLDGSIGVSTKWGPVFKGGLGLYYNPENMFSIGLGLEGTGLLLVKPLDKNKNFTGKLALVYSFGYNF